jgi:serine/threonine-protein kinase
MNAPPAAARGEKLGRYTLVERIASGGMAEIFLAHCEGADGVERSVAVKRILPERARNPEFAAMFMKEARIATTLRHANVIEAFDFGSENGTSYLAMEYLHGQDARRIVQTLAQTGTKLPREIAVASAIGIASGLHYVHERRDSAGQPLGLIHRDVSPQNIFLTTAGGVKLVDFGVAKAVHRVSDTLVGRIKGKVTYMSPEQVRGKQIDRRTDIFSLAIVLWELTVGRRLFEGVSEQMVMNAIDELDAPAPSQMTPRYPPDLERIVMKGLARDRNVRYQTAEEMRIDLEEFARNHQLDVTARNVSSFVRSMLSESRPSELSPGPSPVQREWERALRRGQTPEPKREGARPAPAATERSGRTISWVALGLVVGAGIGTAWLALRNRHADTRPPESAPPVVSAPPQTTPAPPPPKPPAAVEELSDPLPPPARDHRSIKSQGSSARKGSGLD